MGNIKIIAASAGSGKTYRLAYEYVKSVVDNPSIYRHILAVTFTNKATEEMSSRILERLHELATAGVSSPYMNNLLRDLAPLNEPAIRARAAEAQRNILHDYSRFAVLTIDRFFQRLIRSFMRELGVDAGFNLELETDSLLELAADELIDRAADDGPIRERIFAATRDRLDEGKRWNIREPLVSLGGELFGAEYHRVRGASEGAGGVGGGVGGASTVIDRVVERAVAAQAAMKAKATEALNVIKAAGLSADDFKGRSRSFVPWLTKVAGAGSSGGSGTGGGYGGGSGEFLPLSAAARTAAESNDQAAWVVKNSPSRGVVEGLIPVLQPMLEELSEIYSSNSRLVASARLLRENRHNFLLLSDLQTAIEGICRDKNIVPISETNRMIARLVGGNDTPFIFERAGSWFSRFFIDEFQDTSVAQWENFVPLLRNAIASEPGSPVMLIGDVKQAIYRWRGSDWQILSRRVRDEMGADRVDFETLDTNWRSERQIVEFSNNSVAKVVAAGSAMLDGMIAEARVEGALSDAEADSLTGMLTEAYRDHTQKPRPDADGGYVTLTTYGADSEGVYTPPLIARIEELQSRGFRAGDIAVLVRSNTQGARVAQMLLQHKRLNPSSPYCYDVVTAEALTVGASAASRFIIACLTLSTDPADTIPRAIFNRWMGRDFDAQFSEVETEFFARLATLSPEEAFEEVVLRFELNGRSMDVAYIQAIHQQITTFSSRSVADLPLFLKWWNERGAGASITMQQEGGAITVSTIHKSKGLEYKVVIIPYLSWSMAPDPRGRNLVLWSQGSGASSDVGSDASSDTTTATDSGIGDDLAGLGAVPINYKAAMGDSFFSARYYREQVLAHIDAANMFYVAVTRAVEELHLMVSSNPRDGRGSVGNLLKSVLNISEDFTEWGTPSEVGEKVQVIAPAVPVHPSPLTTYPTTRPGDKVRLSLPKSRYFSENTPPADTHTGAENTPPAESEGATLSPRDFGVLMHRAFENATTAADVRRAVDHMLADALVSPAEHVHLQQLIDRAFANPLVAEWFGGEWDVVRNEGDILTPAAARRSKNATLTRRPDRVMMRGGRAVVVDYKFGRLKSPAHQTQLRGYMRLLSDMGHSPVEGHIWYVSLDEIVGFS
jgi:ATP-dependent exoDNAse (exonuclease V) beta subunit